MPPECPDSLFPFGADLEMMRPEAARCQMSKGFMFGKNDAYRVSMLLQ